MYKEVYCHLYNRGAHKAPIFHETGDYIRMLKLLYIANNESPFVMDRLPDNVYSIRRKRPLVEIVAYCLMPNHIHLAVRETSDIDISLFMQKLGTAYSGYYNKKYHHSGTIWQGTYKEKTEFDNTNIETLIEYIHLNPYGINEPTMSKDERRNHPVQALKFSKQYDYSSLKDYLGEIRPQSAILSRVEVKPRHV